MARYKSTFEGQKEVKNINVDVKANKTSQTLVGSGLDYLVATKIQAKIYSFLLSGAAVAGFLLLSRFLPKPLAHKLKGHLGNPSMTLRKVEKYLALATTMLPIAQKLLQKFRGKKR